MGLLRLFVLRLAICVVACLGLIGILTQIHDYPQTRGAFYEFVNGEGMAWLVGFYFMNEAGSGIKYAVTGNSRHLGHYPRGDLEADTAVYHRDYRDVLRRATAGSWDDQLRLSHIHALGWGDVEIDRELAVEWYLRSEARADELGQRGSWEGSTRREQVRALIATELELARIGRSLPETYRVEESGEGLDSV